MQRFLPLAAAAVFSIAACSSGSADDVVTENTGVVVDSVPEPETTTQETVVQAPTEPGRPMVADGPLAEVCPATVVLQLGGQASIEHGAVLSLLADDVFVDAARESVAARIVRPDGTEESVVLEVRFGGPGAGFRSSVDLLGEDSDITMIETGIVDVAAAALGENSVIAVASLTDTSHHMIMWDPQTYPGIESFVGLREAAVEVRHVTGEQFIEFLTARGDLDAAQLTDGFFGEPAAFVADSGASAQQGDALVDPFLYPSIPQWGRPIAFELAAAGGWDSYDDVLAVRTSAIDALTPCLGRLVPIVQDAQISYATNPTVTNARLAAWLRTFNPLTRATAERLDAGAASAIDLGIIATGRDGTVGGFDLDRLGDFLVAADTALGLEPVPLDTIVTNAFIAPDRPL